uniref:Uncharacterized protein n=1 Tax=Arundo donax TaxID=35708 RepID=A0A0A9GEH5_ARUDO
MMSSSILRPWILRFR